MSDDSLIFPSELVFPSDYHSGMTLRDWFAGQALIGLMRFSGDPIEERVELAYKAADAMLKQKALWEEK